MSDARATIPEMKQNRLVPWYGANTANAEKPAELLRGCKSVYVPFAGSMAEAKHFNRSVQMLISDVHDDLITLARIVKNDASRAKLASSLSKKLFHPAELEQARDVLSRAREGGEALFGGTGKERPSDVEIAEAYFLQCWMGRSEKAGTPGESSGGCAVRYIATGGGSRTRFDSAVESLEAWGVVMRRCEFTREDVFDVLARIEKSVKRPDFDPDSARVGVYLDPPWPDDGDRYIHKFGPSKQVKLASVLQDLPHARVVLRFGDHPMIRELYPETFWNWHLATGRDMHRQDKAEVFLERKAGSL